jgi:uncharacterized protein YecE (DUF72 family)
MQNPNLRIGTCSWNYPSWAGLVYSAARRKAVDYLPEYSQQFGAVEVDSWFYRIPPPGESYDYKNAVPPSFLFTFKAPQDITLTHSRNKNADGSLIPNPLFLSPGLLEQFLSVVSPIQPQTGAVMFEFEYLNKSKMPSQQVFQQKLADFFAAAPTGWPYAIETRNANFLNRPLFEFLQSRQITPVFSEKLFLPHIYELYESVKDLIGNTVVIRLLGGDRKEIEQKTSSQWNRLVDIKPDRERIVTMIEDLYERGKTVMLNINNHYEGSAPITIRELGEMLQKRGIETGL